MIKELGVKKNSEEIKAALKVRRLKKEAAKKVATDKKILKW